MAKQLCQFCDQFKELAKTGACKECTEEYETITSYIKSHPKDTIMEISNATKISLKKINLFVDKGKFILIPSEPS